MHRDGSMLAVAASYTYEEGNIDHPPDAVFVRPMQVGCSCYAMPCVPCLKHSSEVQSTEVHRDCHKT